jgi:hypothetical protein
VILDTIRINEQQNKYQMKAIYYLIILVLALILVNCDSKVNKVNILEKYKGRIVETNDGDPSNRMMMKMQMTVQLPQNLTKAQYAELVEYFKGEYSAYENLFVSYLVNGLEHPGYPFWLRTSSPKFEIVGPGYTVDEFAALKSHLSKVGNSIGVWHDPGHFSGSIMATILEKRDSHLVRSVLFSNGEYGVLDTLNLDDGKYKSKASYNNDGLFHKINSEGNLEAWDEQGLFETCIRID